MFPLSPVKSSQNLRLNSSMNHNPLTAIVKKLVLIGGGHSHLAVLNYFAMNPLPGLGITLISRDISTPYSGALAAYLAGHIELDKMHIDLRPLANFADVQLIAGTVENIDLERKKIFISDRPSVNFDILSINTGSTPSINSISGAKEFATGIKPINEFLDKWQQLKSHIESGITEKHHIAFVGAGPASLEIALSMKHSLDQILGEQKQKSELLNFHIFAETAELLPERNDKFRKKLLKTLAENQIQLYLQHKVTAIDAYSLHCENGLSVRVDNVFIATQAAAPAWAEQSGFSTDDNGFIEVNRYLQSVSHLCVFAAGDVASMVHTPRPKSGVYAVRQGMRLAKNLRHYALQEKLKAFKPQKKSLILMSTGRKHVIAARGNWAAEGKIYWRLKNHLDSNFVKKYSELPPLTRSSNIDPRLLDDGQEDEIKELLIQCKGCGSKVGSSILTQTIHKLSSVQHENILSQLGTTEDAAILDIPADRLLVQSIDSIPALLNDPYLFGMIASQHCLSDIYAMGATPHSALVNVILKAAGSKILQEELELLMLGVTEVLNAHDTALMGGHTTQGEELNLGLVINGLVEKSSLLTKSGVQENDRIILTKALGTGTLFVADMARKAKNTWIETAIDSMLESNQTGSETFKKFNASACTDVTGFGLAGHLLEMLNGNKAMVSVSLKTLPILPGAKGTLTAGFLSSLHAQNSANARPFIETRKAVLHPILFDPQTSGGLLAAVPEALAERCLEELSRLNCKASIIGKVLSVNNPEAKIKLL